MAWHLDSKGMFSVRSAYRVHVNLIENQKVRHRGEGATVSRDPSCFWRALWKTRCLGRVHHFLWRLANNSHPLRRNVERIGVELETDCVLCHRLPEDGGHLFLRCKEVRKMWRECGMECTHLKLLECQSPKELLELLFQLPTHAQLSSICLLWCWWTERNKANHGQRRMTPEEFHFNVRPQVLEWKSFWERKLRTRPDQFRDGLNLRYSLLKSMSTLRFTLMALEDGEWWLEIIHERSSVQQLDV